jgi:hypothetical protein
MDGVHGLGGHRISLEMNWRKNTTKLFISRRNQS